MSSFRGTYLSRTPGARRPVPRLPTSGRNSMVLPQPSGPITASVLPAGTANDSPGTPRSSRTDRQVLDLEHVRHRGG